MSPNVDGTVSSNYEIYTFPKLLKEKRRRRKPGTTPGHAPYIYLVAGLDISIATKFQFL
jgi:hypothetical protein